MSYEDMIDREKRRRALIVQKLDETDRRIAMLIAMSKQPDPLDKWLDEQTASSTPALTSAASASHTGPVSGLTAEAQAPSESASAKMTRDTPRKITPQWVALIAHLGLAGKDFAQVQAFLKSTGKPMTPGSIRTGLMNYRKDYGLVSNPKPGFYIATEKGMVFASERMSKIATTETQSFFEGA